LETVALVAQTGSEALLEETQYLEPLRLMVAAEAVLGN
jgi:hypothetical protein